MKLHGFRLRVQALFVVKTLNLVCSKEPNPPIGVEGCRVLRVQVCGPGVGD